MGEEANFLEGSEGLVKSHLAFKDLNLNQYRALEVDVAPWEAMLVWQLP